MTTGPGADLEQLRRLLAKRLGLAFDDKREPLLAEVLQRRAAQHGLSARGYLDRLAAAWHSELAAVAEAVTINETYFFRNIEQFHALGELALPERMRTRAQAGERCLRMLSVGCSTGEEAYTLAMVAAGRVEPKWDVSIAGLDVNRAALRVAAAGRYSRWSLRETPQAEQQRWFRSDGDGVVVDERLRAKVRFLAYNVAEEDTVLFAPGTYDVIFCRNLLMYLTPDTTRGAVDRITRALAPGGFLFLGHTDTLGSRPAGLSVRHSHGTFYYRKDPAAAPAAQASRPAQASGRPVAAAAGGERDDRRERALRLLEEGRFGDALVVLDAIAPPAADRSGVLLARAAALAHVGRTGEAAVLCRRLLDRDVLNADAHLLLGECHEGDDDPAAALEHLRTAAYLDAAFAMPRLRLGLLARRRGDRAEAGRELDRAMALLRHESDERIVMFGGGFGRGALIALCQAELAAAR